KFFPPDGLVALGALVPHVTAKEVKHVGFVLCEVHVLVVVVVDEMKASLDSEEQDGRGVELFDGCPSAFGRAHDPELAEVRVRGVRSDHVERKRSAGSLVPVPPDGLLADEAGVVQVVPQRANGRLLVGHHGFLDRFRMGRHVVVKVTPCWESTNARAPWTSRTKSPSMTGRFWRYTFPSQFIGRPRWKIGTIPSKIVSWKAT